MMGITSSREPDSGALTASRGEPSEPAPGPSAVPPLMLFVSRLNTGSSILAEAILRQWGRERVRAASAGRSAADPVHPYTIECLQAHGVPTTGLRSKAWSEFFGPSKLPIRFLIALEEVYAAEAHWPPHTLIAKWNTPDPAAALGDAVDIRIAFEETYISLHARIQAFLSLQWEHMKYGALLQALAAIGERS